jgi:hypothetical protein
VNHRCCHCCTHSIGHGAGLWCALIDGPATSACASWAREPGADCGERQIQPVRVRPAALAVRPGPMLHRSDAARDDDTGGAMAAGEHDDKCERGVAA